MNAEPIVTREHRAGRRPRVSPRVVRAVGVATAAVLLTSACAAGQQSQTAYQKSSIDGTNTSVGTMDLRGLAIVAPPSLGRSYAAGSDAFLTVVIVNNGRNTDQLTGISTSAATSWAAFSTQADAFAVQQAAGAQVTGSPVPAPSSSQSSSPSASGTPTGSSSISGSTSPDPSGSSETSGSSSASASASTSSAAALPTGSQSVTIASNDRASFGVPDATGALLLTGLTSKLFPGSTVKITFTFAKAGSVTAFVPVQLADIARTAEVPGSTEESG